MLREIFNLSKVKKRDMGVVEFIIVLIIALVVAGIFFYGFKRRGPWGTFWVFLLILFLAGLAGRLWINPSDTENYGYAWLPVVFWVFVVAALIGMASGGTRAEGQEAAGVDKDNTDENTADVETAITFGIFFWVLVTVLLVAIIVGLLT